MRYRDRATGEIYTLFDIQQKFPDVSFPVDWNQSTYDFANVDPVITVSAPDIGLYNRAQYDGVQFINGAWKDSWSEVPRYDDPTEQAEFITACLDREWGKVRVQRNQLLTETDYTQLSDTPITLQSKNNFQNYRQALRDITSQQDPYNITWPTLPIYEKE